MRTKEPKEKDDAQSPPPEKVFFDNRIKRKNVLALNEKVAAIREYEKMPVYKRVGRMFHCSPDQIKRIVQQKESILKAWEQRTRRCQDAKTLEMKVVRVSMLGKAVYDWIRRMMYYMDFKVTDGLIQKMALQFKSAMGLQNFFPHQDWCDKFRQTYNINVIDSKQLKIGYTQGYSVQIKDVMKDVLSECTPDVVDKSGDDDQKNENSEQESKINVQQRDTKSKATPSQLPSNDLSQRTMPKLQPIRQLVALPIQGGGVGMSQKVLVATPISSVGQFSMNNTASPMTMTIIPLATIAQPKNAQSATTAGANGATQTVPPPMVEIKREIKQEPPEEIQIKQECVSDDEDVIAMESDHEAELIADSPVEVKQINVRNSQDTHEMDTDYDNLALSSLRKLIKNQHTATRAESAPSQSALQSSRNVLPTLAPSPRERAVSHSRSPNATPPLPPLIKAPTAASAFSRATNRRIQNHPGLPSLTPIKSCLEARQYLKMLEDFALFKENFRLIGLITRADEVLRELDGDDDIDID